MRIKELTVGGSIRETTWKDLRNMVSTIWVTITSLIGVVIGGALSLFSQYFVERSAARRHAATILEGRRAERLAELIAFIKAAQKVERLATALHQHNASGDTFIERTEAALDELWVRLRAVQLLSPSEVSEAARALAIQAHAVVRQGPGDQSVADFLRPSRTNLIAVAKTDLERV
jgi:hypothetical protein